MNKILFLTRVLYEESKKRNFVLKSLFASFFYVTTSILLINYKSFISFGLADYTFLGKIKVLFFILVGSFQALDVRDATLLVIVSVLFGLNAELVLRKIRFLASYGSLHITFGTGLITLAATGCASCGLSLASLVGLGGALAALPFGGLELYIASILILTWSLFFNLDALVKACKIKY